MNGELTRTQINDAKMMFWDVIDPCTGMDCVLYSRCTYAKGSNCIVQQKYLKRVQGTLLKNAKGMNEKTLMRLGLEVFPLYRMLCRMKMKEAALESDEMFYTSASGTIKVHPVFEEIRKIMRVLDSLWANVGMSNPVDSEGKPTKGIDMFEHGDPDFFRKQQEGFASIKGRDKDEDKIPYKNKIKNKDEVMKEVRNMETAQEEIDRRIEEGDFDNE